MTDPVDLLEEKALRMGAVAFVRLPKPGSADETVVAPPRARPRAGDCGCTEGSVCRQNGNCPRRVVDKRPS